MGRSPTVETLAAFGVVYAGQLLGGVVGLGPLWFALAAPLSVRPWTLATSVYAHAGPGHLLTNAVALVLVGLVVERATSRARFHAFFLAAGALSGVVQVTVGGLLGRPRAVLGASGAVLALLGYLLAGNRLTAAVLDRLGSRPRLKLAALVVVAGLLTLGTASPGVALVAHFTGLALGLAAGRAGVLST